MSTIFINLNQIQENKRMVVFDKPGKYIVFFQNLSGKAVFELKSPGVDLNIYGLYIGKKKDQFNIETIQKHVAPASSSNLLVKGVFYDQSRFVYQGLIRIEKKAQKSHAYQKNKNLIISDRCFVDSRPFLEILANDVYCTHGSTTGKLDRDQLYYLQSRGLDKDQAEKLLIEGFIKEIKDKISFFLKKLSS